MKPTLALFTTLALAPLAALHGVEAPQPATKPNVLLITADDLGLLLSCCGEKRIATPNLDALAVEGVRFANAYVAQSSCSPSRAALLTGRWPHQNGQIGLAHLGFRMHPGLPEKPLTVSDIQEPLPLNATDPSKNALATARLLNTVLRLDAGVGLLLDELEAEGFADNTLVIFVGDNGTAMPRGKTWSYETGVRVPMLVRWPGGAKAGQIRAETVSLLDLMPTVLAACGVQAPDSLAGTALQPLLRGEPGLDWREFLFTEMDFHEPQIFRGQRTVRDRRYKLVLNLATDEGQAPVELFDLQTDPGETKNLADDPAHAGARKKLEAAMQGWREKRADPLLDPARAQRWKDAAARWARLPRVKAGPKMVVRIPEGDLELLK